MTSFIVTIRILATVLPAFATGFTSLRLYYRWSRRHLGWDDAWVAFAALCEVFLCAGAWTRSDTPETGPFRHGPQVRILGYYMLMVSFTFALWAARMSILCSIIRLIPYMVRMRYYYMSTVLFGLMWSSLVMFKIVTCEINDEWKIGPGFQCVLGTAVAALELTTDFTADIILVSMPIRLLSRIKLSPMRRILLTGIFSASMFTTVTSIIHGVYVLSHNRNAEGIWAHIMASTAVIVANLAVLVPWALRALGHSAESEINPSDASPRGADGQAPPKDLTTLRFHHHTGPIVLHSLDKKNHGTTTRSIGSCASNESLTPMTFAPSASKPVGSPSPLTS